MRVNRKAERFAKPPGILKGYATPAASAMEGGYLTEKESEE
jgi:hypothetical protein